MKKMGGGEEDGEGTGDRGGRDYSTIPKRNLSKILPLEDPLDPKFRYKCLCTVASSPKHPAAAQSHCAVFSCSLVWFLLH